jgi:hypothetical protein
MKNRHEVARAAERSAALFMRQYMVLSNSCGNMVYCRT